MLLFEQVRQVADEEQIFSGSTGEYSSAHDWTDRLAKTFTLSKEKIVYLKISVQTSVGEGAGRILLDDEPVVGTGAVYDTAKTCEVFLLLAAGTYTVKFQTALWQAGTIKISSAYIGALNFPDKAGSSAENAAYVNSGAEGTIVELNFTAPPSRKTPIGTIKKVYVAIIAFMKEDTYGYRDNKPKNPGEPNESNNMNWRIYVDDTAKSWSERNEDAGAYSATNTNYGEGAYGCLRLVVDPGQTINIKLKAANGWSVSMTGHAWLWVFACPWIIPDQEYEPVNLDFPDGSTLYLVLEPLNANPTKTVKIGKQRFVSFGDSTDYYYLASGTDILTATYTFELIPVQNCVLKIEGFGGCISVLGVDIR